MGLCLWEVPAVKSLSHGYAVPAPFNKGAILRPVSAGSARSQFRTKLVCNRYFPDPPGIVLWFDTGLFQSFNRQRGKETPQKPQTITGAGGKTHHPEPKRRVNPGWFHPGDS